MEGEGGVIGTTIEEVHSSNIERDQMEGESGLTQIIFD